MNKKVVIVSVGLFIVFMTVTMVLVLNDNSKSYDNYIDEPSITLEEEDSNIIKDDYSIVREYYENKGISGKLYSYSINDESVPDSISNYDVLHYYELASNGVIYYAIVVDGQVIEIEE